MGGWVDGWMGGWMGRFFFSFSTHSFFLFVSSFCFSSLSTSLSALSFLPFVFHLLYTRLLSPSFLCSSFPPEYPKTYIIYRKRDPFHRYQNHCFSPSFSSSSFSNTLVLYSFFFPLLLSSSPPPLPLPSHLLTYSLTYLPHSPFLFFLSSPLFVLLPLLPPPPDEDCPFFYFFIFCILWASFTLILSFFFFFFFCFLASAKISAITSIHLNISSNCPPTTFSSSFNS
ncbi:MAG: hypothetical protein BYD32DRAFT_216361 [Podila humilis]|nr:MAG: hypothetical protein BYD32DRAFT_216361 [Podila humilis]